MANGENVQATRLKLGLTQEQLAKLADVDVKTIRKAEQGKRLDLGTLTRVAYGLKTSLLHLIIPTNAENISELKRRESVMQWHQAWDDQDIEALLTLYDEEAILRLPGGPSLPTGGTFRGKSQIRTANLTAWSSCNTAPICTQDFSLFVCDDAVILNGKKSFCLPDGQLTPLACIHIFKFKAELIVDHQVEYDTLEFARLIQLYP